MAEEEETVAISEAAVKKKGTGGDPHVAQNRLSVLSACSTIPKWSFGSAPRFKWSRGAGTPGGGKWRNSNRPQGLTASTSVSTFADDFSVVRGDEEEEEEEFYDGAIDGGRTWSSFGSFDTTFALCKSDRAPHMDGSMDRFQRPRQRTGHPAGKSYNAANVIGEGTAPKYLKSPSYSFGGGKLRPKAEEDRLAKVASAPQLRAQTTEQPRKRRNLSRGFGSEVRLRHKGGPYEMPITPGPCAYEIPRASDPVPNWAQDSLVPWGKRTARRPEMKNKTATDAGPGEYTAHHPFQAAGPSPRFGHHLRSVRSGANFPAPTAYEKGPLIGKEGPSYSVGSGQRSKFSTGKGPSPDTYHPSFAGVEPCLQTPVFGTSQRPSPGDGVDPDEPPGPASYKVCREYRASDKPGTGLPKAERLKQMAGMGPVGFPGPAQYPLKLPKGRSMGLHFLLPNSVETKPGPSDYDPSDSLLVAAPAQYRPLHQTAPRKSPFGQEGSCTEKSGEAMLRRCAVEVARMAEEQGFGVEQKKKAKIAFVTSGPSFSMGARRPAATSHIEHGPMISTYASVG